MATDLAPNQPEAAHTGAAGQTRTVVDLTRLHTEPAPEAIFLTGAVEASVERVAGEVEPLGGRTVARGAVGLLLAVLAPLLVLLGSLLLPVAEPVRGAVLVAGWIAVGLVAQRVESGRGAR